MTIYRGTVLDTPESPFAGGVLRAEADAGVAVDRRGDHRPGAVRPGPRRAAGWTRWSS